MRSGRTGPRGARGFSYLGVLFVVALTGLALAGTGQVWSQASQRERERELLWIGTQYARALQSYYRHSPGRPEYPRHLDELLEDARQPQPQRHLRKLYADPMTGTTDWALVRLADGAIVGVHSRSYGAPIKTGNFPARWLEFRDSRSYADWWFVAEREFARMPARAPGPGEE